MSASEKQVFDRTVTEAVRRSKLAARNDPTFIGSGAFRAKGATAVTRTITDKLQDTIDAADYGVVGDGVTDDTITVQAALDAGFVQNKIVYFRDLSPLITGPLTMRGPGLVFDQVSHGDSGGPGFILQGANYTALSVYGQPQAFAACFYGAGTTIDGVMFGGPLLADDNIKLARIQHVRVFNLDGFGVQINKCFDCVFESISVEQCGNLTKYAFSMNDAGDTCNQTHIMRLQVEKANASAIFISGSSLSCMIDNIHSEQATPDVAVATWFLGGSRSTYHTGTFQADDVGVTATMKISGGQSTYEDFLVESGGPSAASDVSFEAFDSLTIISPEIQGTAHVLTNQTGRVDVFGGKIQTLATDSTFLRIYGTYIPTLTMGFSNSPVDATRARFIACDIDSLGSSSSTSAATFIGCTIAEGNNLLRGKTVLLAGTTVVCAGALAHSSGTLEVRDSVINAAVSYTNASPIRGYGATFNGGITRGDAGLVNVVCDDGCVSIGTTTNAGQPTGGAHTVGERHKNLTPGTGADLGWICTSSGTPGTWAVEASGATLAHALTAGAHLTGGPFDGSGAVTLATDATSSNAASTIVARDASGNFAAHDATLHDVTLSGSLSFGNNFAAGTPAATGFLLAKDLGGTVYKFLVAP